MQWRTAFSFIYGVPPKEILDERRHRGIAIIGAATTVDEAIALEEAGVDAADLAHLQAADSSVAISASRRA